MLMSGRSIPTISGEGQGFPGIGIHLSFWFLLWFYLRTVTVQVGVSLRMLTYYNEHIRKFKVCWKSDLLLS